MESSEARLTFTDFYKVTGHTQFMITHIWTDDNSEFTTF